MGVLHLSVGSELEPANITSQRTDVGTPDGNESKLSTQRSAACGREEGRNCGRDSRGSGAEKDPTGKQVPAKGSILSTSVHRRLSSIVGVQRYILQLGNAWRVTQNTQQRSHHHEFFLPVEQT